MGDLTTNSITDLIRAARQHLAQELTTHAEKLQNLEADLTKLRAHHDLLGQEIEKRWEDIALAGEAAKAQRSSDAALESVLGAVRSLMTCTIPEQVLQILTEEASQFGIRAAVFDVRGKAAWGAAANGFGPELTEKAFRSVVIPLNQENPFRHVCETAGHVDASTDSLKRNRNLLDKLRPAPDASILLLPVRSGGTVAAIFYADAGGKSDRLPAAALKILSEFAGAQLDRLIALSSAIPPDEGDERVEQPAEHSATLTEPTIADEPPASRESLSEEPVEVTSQGTSVGEIPAIEPPYPPVEVIALDEPPAHPVEETAPAAGEPSQAVEESTPTAPVIDSDPTPVEAVPPTELVASPPSAEPSTAEKMATAVPPEVPPAATSFDITQLSEAEQKLHKDAKRFAKLLVSEIELYNKTKVADGRKNKDLYRRMKSDIDRSRQTFDKRFGKTLGKEFDYFNDELVRTLAANDSSVLGPEYPELSE